MIYKKKILIIKSLNFIFFLIVKIYLYYEIFLLFIFFLDNSNYITKIKLR
jgi:hypothetical protein